MDSLVEYCKMVLLALGGVFMFLGLVATCRKDEKAENNMVLWAILMYVIYSL